jgi:tol-pal system protein YbgF
MRTLIVALLVIGVAAPALAQNRREMQMMADIRMLQEQNQQLQNDLQAALAALNEALKAMTGRVDEQAAAMRKGFADQSVRIDQFANDLRVVREGVAENNVRIAQLSQELEAVRMSIPQFPATPPAAVPPGDAGATQPGGNPAAPPVTPPAPLGPGMSPQKLFDTAQADYYAGQWDLCVSGFDTYLRTFPKSPLADQAQFYIGECYSSDAKWQDAVAAYNQVIATHPRSESAANAYYKRGMALERLGQTDRARESYEGAIKNFPDTTAARMAKQALDRLGRKSPE